MDLSGMCHSLHTPRGINGSSIIPRPLRTCGRARSGTSPARSLMDFLFPPGFNERKQTKERERKRRRETSNNSRDRSQKEPGEREALPEGSRV